MADISGQFEVDGIVRQREELEHLLTSDPLMEKRIQALIRKVLLAARREIGNSIKFDKGDPRQARKAVKTAVYRRILGGSVSLLNKRRAGAPGSYEPPRTLRPGQRGGNRAKRGARTKQLMSYQGADRGFILRFLNQGTKGRNIENFAINPKRDEWPSTPKWNKHPNTGFRGNIAPRNFFGPSSQRALQQAAAQLDKLIDELIKQELS